MLPIDLDTIVAIATPSGIGAIGIIRISGPQALAIAKIILKKMPLTSNQAIYTNFLSSRGEILDAGIAIIFKAPNSFTGEDIVELQGHGGPIILELLLNNITSLGARIAEPGEFSKRAFLNNKLDLVQAEGIVSLIHAQTNQAALAAVKTLQGSFSNEINLILANITNIRMYLEAMIDFPEDEIDFKSYHDLQLQITKLAARIKKVLLMAHQGQLLNNSSKAIILGAPNVGKSSLLNCLLEEDKIIVTDLPGTTRDLLSYKVNIDGLIVDFSDTAGIRASNDVIESLGIQKAIKEIKIADLIVLMIAANDINMETLKDPSLKDFLPHLVSPELLINKKIIILINKIDLYDMQPTVIENKDLTIVLVSILKRQGIKLLKQKITQNLSFTEETPAFIAKARHVAALQKVDEYLTNSKNLLDQQLTTWDLLAEELRLAQENLSRITGAFSNEDLLNKIFSEFCIGK